MIWRAGKVETVVLFFLMLIQGVLPVFILYLSKDAINMVIAIADTNDQSFLGRGSTFDWISTRHGCHASNGADFPSGEKRPWR